MILAAIAAGFRLRLGGGVALRLRSRRLSVSATLFPLADHRPKPVNFSQPQIGVCESLFFEPVLLVLDLRLLALAGFCPSMASTRRDIDFI